MSAEAIHGVCPILATPFTASGAVDHASLREEVHALAEGGCHGVALFGIASEFVYLTDEERNAMIETVTEACDDTDLSLIISTTEEATEIAVEQAAAADDAGADCVMVFPPFFMGPSEGDLYEHLARIGRNVSVPVMVQYSPEFTNVTIEPETFAQLSADVENISHYKIECNPSGPYITSLLEEMGDVDVFVGNYGFQAIESFDRGATGVMPGAPFYDVNVEIYERYFDGCRADALELHSRLLPMLNHISQIGGIQYQKRILSRRGIIETAYCRKPVSTPDEYYDALFEHYYDQLCPVLE